MPFETSHILSEIRGIDLNIESSDANYHSSPNVGEQCPDLPSDGSPDGALPNEPAIPSKKNSGTFELKFLIDEGQASDVMAWARQHLDPDPHFDPELGDGYYVNSLYLDTPQFDVFHRAEGFRQQKYRLRRYGCEPLVWFEQKRKRKGLVRKRRVSVEEPQLSKRLELPPEETWEGHWFRRKVDEQLLRPICQVTYQRFARVKTGDEGQFRLTIDNHLTATLANGWTVPAGPLDGVALLDGQRILELKFRGAMPGLFRRLVEEKQLQMTPFSKYRTSVEECVPLDTIADDAHRGRDDE